MSAHGEEEYLEWLQRRCATGNVLYVWDAIQWCNDFGLDYPEWIRQYLGDVAAALLNKDQPQHALMLTQRDYKARGDHEKRVSVVSCVRLVMRQLDKSECDLDVQMEVAERMRVKDYYVRDCWFKWGTVPTKLNS